MSLIDRFARASPVSLLTLGLLRSCFEPPFLNALAEKYLRPSSLRQLPFSGLVQLLIPVVFEARPSVRQAYLHDSQVSAAVTLKCVYERLHTVPPALADQLVQATAERIQPLCEPSTPFCGPLPASARRWFTLDGTHLAPTQRRLAVLQEAPAPQPGWALLLRDHATGLFVRMRSCADAHANERTEFAGVPDWFAPGDAVVADTSFCVYGLLRPLDDGAVGFVVRHHGSVGLTPVSPPTPPTRTATGTVTEQRVRYAQTDWEVRCVSVELDRPLENGQTQLRILTNLPPEQWSAAAVAEQYRTRWTIENAFQELTEAVEGEVDTLAHPQAALLAFAVAVAMYNVLRVIRVVAEREGDGKTQLSPVLLSDEVGSTLPGLMIAVGEETAGLPNSGWSVEALRSWIEALVRQIRGQKRYAKSRRGHRKKRRPSPNRRNQHSSTARLLAKCKNQRCQR